MTLDEYYSTCLEYSIPLEAWLDQVDRSQRNLKSEDFDFPVSLAFRQAWSQQYDGEQPVILSEAKKSQVAPKIKGPIIIKFFQQTLKPKEGKRKGFQIEK